MKSSQMTSIEIDIDVHRAIEGKRTYFQESHNDILRNVFGLSKGEPQPIPKTRRTGKYAFRLHGK